MNVYNQQVLTGELNLGNNQNPQQQLQNETTKEKKKKCHGNRKAQHLRRRLRRQEQKKTKDNVNPMDQDMVVTDDHDDYIQREQHRMQVSAYTTRNNQS